MTVGALPKAFDDEVPTVFATLFEASPKTIQNLLLEGERLYISSSN
jgi:hypothetical protein